ncbi:GNAT family N-acetyltransferase [Ornithinibacillus salinisoli]|uniref:GNAT family N-acetyltransferase n=1 Tax=Ornithinibacillus salinisoli TaxID=1848459 RepID=A0ABW4VZG4_9BACI
MDRKLVSKERERDRMGSSIIIDNMVEADWEMVRNIYIEGIQTGNATFETEPPSWEQWDDSHVKKCRFVVKESGVVIGWAALSSISIRAAYRGAVEVSIYFTKNSIGKGIGSLLLKHLIHASEENGFWTLQASIFPENESSIHLHEKYGFKKVGTRKRIGKLNGVWRDVVLLERRSDVVGID